MKEICMSNFDFEKDGFEILDESQGMENALTYSAKCSGGRSDCCTRTCSADENFVADEESWAKFLDVKGGQIQY
jgi:hypothetical protein